MSDRIGEIRRRVAASGTATEDDIDAVDGVIEAEGPSAAALVLRGQLIRLCAEDEADALDEALACYEEAIELDPGSAEAHEEIGHFLDDVADEPAEAILYFRKAIELGGGVSAQEGLREVLGRLGWEDV